MVFAKADLDVPKEIAPEEIAPDGHGADRGIKSEASEVGMRYFEAMNSRGQGETYGRIQSEFAARHEVEPKGGNYEGAIEQRKFRARIKVGHDGGGYLRALP